MKSGWEERFSRLSERADRFLPVGPLDPEAARQKRTIVLGSVLGLAFSNGTALSYWALGSFWSAVSISLITLGLLSIPFLIRRGVSTVPIGHLMAALTAQAGVVVALRSGGFDSPAIIWFCMLPIISYLASGYAGSVVWSVVALIAIVGFFVAERAGAVFAHDFGADQLSLLRVTGFPGVIVSTGLILWMVEGVRVRSLQERDRTNRAIERQRMLGDMHDGVGGHLMGLIVRVRAKQVEGDELQKALQACLDDLRLVVDSLDPDDRVLEVALGELRQRAFVQSEASGIALEWQTEGTGELMLPGDRTLDVLRACQEMLSNAMRHAKAKRIVFRLELRVSTQHLIISVRDDGVGFDPVARGRSGRGVTSLKARATKLNGSMRFEPANPGTVATLEFPASVTS